MLFEKLRISRIILIWHPRTLLNYVFRELPHEDYCPCCCLMLLMLFEKNSLNSKL